MSNNRRSLPHLVKWTLCLLLLQGNLVSQSQSITSGLQISSSVKFAKAVYKLNTDSSQNAAVVEIRGNNLVVDFNNALMDGNLKNTTPEQFYGTAIRIVSGKNIVIKNLRARGYKIVLSAVGIKGLVIQNCDFSYNYRQRLYSTQRKEDLSDWMSYHHNENDEWMRYGAAIYLRNCNNAVISDNVVMGGQCALMLTACDSARVTNNNFSFNSGLGIGMYRSSNNQVLRNRLDYNVRGHSEGVYNRGQDAAAILVFEQCHKNLFALNSATHSGDGFFLWAGQTTMDSGKGGCNDNIILQNDFSYAPTNGVEVTFSRNVISGNKLTGCDNGIWAGYSYQSQFRGNDIIGCNTGIAIEHGQDNYITLNLFGKNKTAVKLWGRASQPADWGYARTRDTRSRDYTIAQNAFVGNRLVFDLARTRGLKGDDNDTFQNRQLLKTDTSVHGMTMSFIRRATARSKPLLKADAGYLAQARVYGEGIPPVIQAVLPRSGIRMLEWGPYDYQSPLLWNSNPLGKTDTMEFDVLGPSGRWKLSRMRGIKALSADTGSIPGHVYAIRSNKPGEDILIELSYMGGPIVTPMGEKIAGGKPWLFNYRNAELPVSWHTQWFGFDSSQHPVEEPALLSQIEATAPIATDSSAELRYAWWSGIGKETKTEQFVTLAEADAQLPAGDYLLGVSWEDVIRVYVDGSLILDEWKPLGHAYDESPHREIPLHLGGSHHFRVEHANQAGFATLIVTLKKK
jgi:parallel beta-helix repeat protein